jgi:hypothetical protein
MPIFTEKAYKLTDVEKGFDCDKCKQRFMFITHQADGINEVSSLPDVIRIKHQFGYASSYDMHKVDVTLCEPCFEKMCTAMHLLPRKYKL